MLAAYRHTLKAAEATGEIEATVAQIRTLVAAETGRERFVTRVLGRELGLPLQ